MAAEHADQQGPGDGTSTGEAHRFINSVHNRLHFETHVALVVDDEPDMRKLICEEIKRAAADVLTVQAGNGEEAVAKLADIRSSFDTEPLFIVTDLNMPDVDGWQLIHHLKDEYEAAGHDQGIPLIVLSSTTGERRALFSRESVHGGKAEYVPLVSVAKENCTDPLKYDAIGRDGLVAWMRHFLQSS